MTSAAGQDLSPVNKRPTKASFLEIPSELRLQTYEYLFDPQFIDQHHEVHDRGKRSSRKRIRSCSNNSACHLYRAAPAAALLTTCRLVFDEAMPVLYGHMDSKRSRRADLKASGLINHMTCPIRSMKYPDTVTTISERYQYRTLGTGIAHRIFGCQSIFRGSRRI